MSHLPAVGHVDGSAVAGETRYQLLVEHAPIGMCEVSRDGRLLWVNGALVEMLGYATARELQQAPLPPFLTDETLFSHEASAGPRAAVEAEWRRKDGETVAVRLRAHALPNTGSAEPSADTAAIVVEDMSERRALEERLRFAYKQEVIGRLAGGIAHDFNNMLTAILGYSDMLLEQLDEQKPIYQDLLEIGKAADRAATLTRQLLALSRRQVLKLQPLDLNDIVRDIEPMIRRLIGERIVIDVHMMDDLPSIKADRTQIEQVIVNLALNARDAMPEGGRLTVETSVASLEAGDVLTRDGGLPGDYVRLTVTDTGAGMTPEVRAKLFEPFFTTKALGHGTGLGLATVYGTVKQLGGHIGIDSEPSAGAAFRLYFPPTGGSAAKPSPRPDRRGQPIGAESVLLVEDEDTVRTFCRKVLRRHGYQVIEAANPSAAFAALLATGRGIDLVLTDVAMPGMSGEEMVRKLQGTLPAFTTLYMSGYGDQFARRGIDCETALLEKPFTAAQLLQRVRDALDVTKSGQTP
jgi:two-component system, cell cycle sensor histidine kinase and response regulator CckA